MDSIRSDLSRNPSCRPSISNVPHTNKENVHSSEVATSKKPNHKEYVGQVMPKKIAFNKTASFSLSQSNINATQAQQSGTGSNMRMSETTQPSFSGDAVYRIEECGGQRYEGLIINGKKEGFGRLTYSNGSYYEGAFHENMIQGVGKLFNGGGDVIYDG